MPEFICPTRDEKHKLPHFRGDWTISDLNPEPGPDSWLRNDTCSFCKGLRPSMVLDALGAGERMRPTDSEHKGFINPDKRPFFFQHFNTDEQRKFINLMKDDAGVQIRKTYSAENYEVPFFLQ